MSDFVEILFFGIVFAIWLISQVTRRGRRRRGRAIPRQRRPARQRPVRTQRRSAAPSRAEPERQVTLEEWMERVRQGQVPAPPTAQPSGRQAAPAAPPSATDPGAILREWQQRTQQPAEARQETPRRQPPATAVPTPDPYARRGDQRARLEAERARQRHERDRAAQAAEERARAEEEQRREEILRRRQAAAQQRRRRKAPAQPAVPRTSRAAAASPGHQRRHQKRHVATKRAYSLARGRRGAPTRPGLDLTRAGVRQGILMTEILGPPLALRRRAPGPDLR